MTDKEKLEAIKAEIHRLVDVRGYDKEMANDLFTFMDSLPNEPVSEDLEEASKKYSSCIYLEEVLSDDDREVLKERLINTFKAGAQWQARHSLETIKGMEEQAFLAGVEAEQINQNYGKDLLYVCNQTSERTKKEFIDKDALVAEIKTRIETYNKGYANGDDCRADALETFLHDIDTLEVKEIPETTYTECKKIKKLCEIKRYDENGKEYSIMLPDTRLFMNKINDIIEAIEDLDLRLQTIEALNIDYGKCKTEILEKVRKVSHLIANKGNVNFKRIDERLRKIEQRIGG